jgi:hypothetical protein
LYKIKIKSPSKKGQILFFTVKQYKLTPTTISFIDKLGIEQTWNVNHLINIEMVVD